MPAPRKQAPAKSAPETQSKESGVAAVAAPETKQASPTVEKQKYYRIRKITGFLSEIIEVEVDESVNVPVVVSKQDLREILMARLEDFICNGRKKK